MKEKIVNTLHRMVNNLWWNLFFTGLFLYFGIGDFRTYVTYGNIGSFITGCVMGCLVYYYGKNAWLIYKRNAARQG